MRRIRMQDKTKLLALVLATYADPDGSRVRPGSKALCAVTGYSPSTVRRRLAELRDDYGLIEITARGGGRGRGGRTTTWRLTLPVDLLDRVDLLAPNDASEDPADDPAVTRETPQSAPRPVDNPHPPVIQATGQSRPELSTEANPAVTQATPENRFQESETTTPGRLRRQNDPIDRSPRRLPTTHIPTTNYDQPPTGLPTQPPTARKPDAQPEPFIVRAARTETGPRVHELAARTQARLAAIADCGMCDDHGYTAGSPVPCDHDPASGARYARGIALARAAVKPSRVPRTGQRAAARTLPRGLARRPPSTEDTPP
ncbi:helix-turn-helix domain-containing protein [Saccharothrix sp. HUAS TT1]|uniref:helix-turn-helix domain-containing protein n=1 Tax=unclassified Saccharothrix TaxID=2593673 RepID=UPI00345B7EB1